VSRSFGRREPTEPALFKDRGVEGPMHLRFFWRKIVPRGSWIILPVWATDMMRRRILWNPGSEIGLRSSDCGFTALGRSASIETRNWPCGPAALGWQVLYRVAEGGWPTG